MGEVTLHAGAWARIEPAGRPSQVCGPGTVHATLKLETTPATQAAQPLPAAHGALLRLGLWVQGLGRESLRTASFVGEVLLATLRLLRGKSAMRGVDLWRQIDLTGPLSLPIVALTCFLVGLMLAYMGGSQLGRMGAQEDWKRSG